NLERCRLTSCSRFASRARACGHPPALVARDPELDQSSHARDFLAARRLRRLESATAGPEILAATCRATRARYVPARRCALENRPAGVPLPDEAAEGRR